MHYSDCVASMAIGFDNWALLPKRLHLPLPHLAAHGLQNPQHRQLHLLALAPLTLWTCQAGQACGK